MKGKKGWVHEGRGETEERKASENLTGEEEMRGGKEGVKRMRR